MKREAAAATRAALDAKLSVDNRRAKKSSEDVDRLSRSWPGVSDLVEDEFM